MQDYIAYNSRMWDAWSKDHNIWSIPLTPEQFQQAKNVPIEFVLTPTKTVPISWFEGVGKDVLGLASGGGQQGPVMAAHGFSVTILDNSMRQLQSERMVAEREDYQVLALQADMTLPFPFKDESFDMIIHPVSNCYIEDLQPTWNECYRVLRHGGVMMAGWTNPIVYMFDGEALENQDAPLIIRKQATSSVTHWKRKLAGSSRRASCSRIFTRIPTPTITWDNTPIFSPQRLR